MVLTTGGLLGADEDDEGGGGGAFLSEYCRRLICFDELLPDSAAAAATMVGDKARFGDWKRAGLSNGVDTGSLSGAFVGSMFMRLDSSGSCAVTFG